MTAEKSRLLRKDVYKRQGYIYASFYGGAVAKINAKTLEVVDKLTGLGDNLEGVATVSYTHLSK